LKQIRLKIDKREATPAYTKVTCMKIN
jgi:hypothetical protein